jgi:diguanylate cyclase (GGDEF)-like protein
MPSEATMKTATRVPLVYLAISIGWLLMTNSLSGDRFVLFDQLPLFAKGFAFTIASAVLLHFLLLGEERRRDAVEDGLRARAIRDPLTGLLNRTCFSENLSRSIARAERDKTNVAVAFIDMDGFKQINDRCGHHVGDQLLIEVAARIRGVIRVADCAARFGGDEFVVLCEGEREDGAVRLAERLRAALARPIVVDSQIMRVSASVGIAMYPEHGASVEQLLCAADKAMYRAKESGKDAAFMALRPVA